MGARGITRSSLGETTAKGKIPNSICHSFLFLFYLTIALREEGLCVSINATHGVCVCVCVLCVYVFTITKTAAFFPLRFVFSEV